MTLDCETSRSWLADLADGRDELDADGERFTALEAHLARCTACVRIASRMRWLRQLHQQAIHSINGTTVRGE